LLGRLCSKKCEECCDICDPCSCVSEGGCESGCGGEVTTSEVAAPAAAEELKPAPMPAQN
jgi:hypothetical protein